MDHRIVPYFQISFHKCQSKMEQSCSHELWLACRYFKLSRQTVSPNQITIPGNYSPGLNKKKHFIIYHPSTPCYEFFKIVLQDILKAIHRFVNVSTWKLGRSSHEGQSRSESLEVKIRQSKQINHFASELS